jgi:glycosyltransferase involved in cell wall biosynthesis
VRVLHVITNLGQGGAEAVLYSLVTASPPDLEHVVISLMGEAYYGPRLRARATRVHTLDNPRGRITLVGVFKLRRIIAETAPDIVQTWMYHADLVGGLSARWAGVRSVVWGMHNSTLDADKSRLSTRVIARTCAFLSAWVPAAIACCSVKAAQVHQAIGYSAEKFTIIPNGYDLSRFLLDAEGRARVREEWDIPPATILLGMVARWDAQKDHENLLGALALLNARGLNFRCVLVGPGMERNNVGLAKLIGGLGLADRLILAGPRDDIPAVMNALDLHVLSSAYGEAFPNVVAEAMACGTPCVVTDVGDAALIVGKTGWVVPPRNAPALAQGINQALIGVAAVGHEASARECRIRIEENFSVERMVKSYRALWEATLNTSRGPR